MGEYRTILADPPWSYGRDDARFPSAPGAPGRQRRVEKHIGYATMATPAIAALPVRALADRHCRLFLWATSKHLPDAFAVLGAWGFAYKQTIVWRKTRSPTPMGGSIAPNHAEFLLVATVGSPPVLCRHRSSVVEAPRQARHSAKPEAFFGLVEQVSPGPYLELFARRERLGWDQAGDQSAGTVHVPGLRAPEDAAA